MLAKIGEFTFAFGAAELEEITHTLTYGWEKKKRIGNHPLWRTSGKSEESIDITGNLVLKSVHALDDFETMAEAQEPVRLTLGTGESYMIVITSLTRRKGNFIPSGKYMTQAYSMKLERYYE